MVRKLIVNADDYGLTEGVSLGILKAHRDGILTSTTCMMNMDNIEEYLKMTKDYPNLGLGVHLTITLGKPLTKVSFVDENGYFLKAENRKPIVNQEELYQEWKAQIDKFISIMKRKPSHLDSHHHVHLLPGNIDIALKLAKEYQIPLRQETYLQDEYEEVIFEEIFYAKNTNLEAIKTIINRDNDIFEFMCHPAFIDWKLYNISSYNLNRANELNILCSQEAKDICKDIEFINYYDIKKI